MIAPSCVHTIIIVTLLLLHLQYSYTDAIGSIPTAYLREVGLPTTTVSDSTKDVAYTNYPIALPTVPPTMSPTGIYTASRDNSYIAVTITLLLLFIFLSIGYTLYVSFSKYDYGHCICLYKYNIMDKTTAFDKWNVHYGAGRGTIISTEDVRDSMILSPSDHIISSKGKRGGSQSRLLTGIKSYRLNSERCHSSQDFSQFNPMSSPSIIDDSPFPDFQSTPAVSKRKSVSFNSALESPHTPEPIVINATPVPILKRASMDESNLTSIAKAVKVESLASANAASTAKMSLSADMASMARRRSGIQMLGSRPTANTDTAAAIAFLSESGATDIESDVDATCTSSSVPFIATSRLQSPSSPIRNKSGLNS